MQLRTELYIDLGTANTLIYSKGKGFILNQPSTVALRHRGNNKEVYALGDSAKKMIGKTPMNLQVVRPLRDGVIADFSATEKMLSLFLKRVKTQIGWFRPRVVISLPCRVTQFEKRAVEEAGFALGARSVDLVEEPVVAALGAGLVIDQPFGKMIVDIGGGTTEIAVISLGRIVYANAIRVGGDEMDENIQEFIREKYQFLIGEQTAEQLKIHYADALPTREQLIEIKGKSLLTQMPSKTFISNLDIHEAINPTIESIISSIRTAFENCPPEIIADLGDEGLTIAGGGALIRNLDKRITEAIGIKVSVAKEPLYSVAFGGAKVLENQSVLEMVKL